MINKVVVTNPKGEALELVLTNPEKSGLAVVDIEGLGPPRANINGQEMASADGMFYSSARAEARNIVFTLALMSRDRNSAYGYLSIEDARHLTYRYFPLKKQITVTVYTDSQTLYTKGYVESNEPGIFSQQEQVDISVICPDPFMYEIGDAKTVFSGTQPRFEFPFEDDALILDMVQDVSPYLLETYGVNVADNQTTRVTFDSEDTGPYSFNGVGKAVTTDYIAGRLRGHFGMFGISVSVDETYGYLVFTNSDGLVDIKVLVDNVKVHYVDRGLKEAVVKPEQPNDKELLQMGEIWLDTTAVLDYDGTVDTGIIITIHAFGDCENIHLYNVDTREEIFIDTNKINTITKKPFQAKDDIIISTVRGDRYCRLLRDGQYINIIGALGKFTDWFQISNGSNAFGFSAESGANNISVTFSYQNAYVGV